MRTLLWERGGIYAAGMTRFGVAELLAEARAGDRRVAPGELAAEMRDGALVVDIRPLEQRERDGELRGALVIDRNVLEWRLDPGCPHRIPQASAAARVIVVCSQGYASSLAAHTLRRLGVARATDLAGGYEALSQHGLLPTDPEP